jgi:hypothetical protein
VLLIVVELGLVINAVGTNLLPTVASRPKPYDERALAFVLNNNNGV